MANYDRGYDRDRFYSTYNRGPIRDQPRGYGYPDDGPLPRSHDYPIKSSRGLPPPVVHQPTRISSFEPTRMNGRDWSTNLFDCSYDLANCANVCCNPCYMCRQVHQYGEDGVIGCLCPLQSFTALRYKMRHDNGIAGSLLEDIMAVSCCFQCARCQLDREKDNIERHKRGMR